MDDFNRVRRIVPCTNLNIDDILNLESSRDLPEKPSDKLSSRNRATEEPQPGSQDLSKHQPTISRGDQVNLEYWLLDCPHLSADPS